MKIYKIAAPQQFPLIPQNTQPNQPANPDAQLQNLQQSQQAMQFLQEVMQTSSEVSAKVNDLDTVLGIDTGLNQIIQQKVQQAISQTPAFNILSKMGLMTSPNDLNNANTMSMLNTRIQTQIGQAGQTGMGQ